MIIKLSTKTIYIGAMASFLLLVSARGYSTSYEVYSIARYLSILGAASLPIFLFLAAYKAQFRQKDLIVTTYVLIIVLLAYFRGYSINPEYSVYFIITVVAIMTGSVLRNPSSDFASSAGNWLFYIFIGFFLLNVILGNPFEYRYGEDYNNYQGISRLSGVLFCSFILFSLRSNNKLLTMGSVLIAAIFLVICLSGGGRGELIAAVICILPAAFQKRRGFALLALAVVVILFNLEYILETRGIQRIFGLIETNSSGLRAELGLDAIAILTSDATTFFIGCGINCFQHRLGYTYGSYPHNYILEAIVTFGILGTLPFLFMIARLLKHWFSAVRNEGYLLVLISMFFFLVSLKSGAMMSAFSTTLLLFVGSTIQPTSQRRNVP